MLKQHSGFIKSRVEEEQRARHTLLWRSAAVISALGVQDIDGTLNQLFAIQGVTASIWEPGTGSLAG